MKIDQAKLKSLNNQQNQNEYQYDVRNCGESHDNQGTKKVSKWAKYLTNSDDENNYY